MAVPRKAEPPTGLPHVAGQSPTTAEGPGSETRRRSSVNSFQQATQVPGVGHSQGYGAGGDARTGA
jgi:hypothetical protein